MPGLHPTKRLLVMLGLPLALIIALACNSVTEGLSSVLPNAPDCKSATDPTQRDVDYSLAFTGDTFKSKEWQRSYTVKSMRASVSWMNDGTGSLAYLDYMIFSCGYTQKDIDRYFSAENFRDVFFVGYQNLQRVTTCTQAEDDLTLHEFTAEHLGEKYLIRDWIKLDTPTRVVDLVLVFPLTSKTQLDIYARQIFPDLSTCQD